MSVFTTHALVLRTFPHKESDLIVRLFTEEFGRVSGVARGARRPKSPLTGKLEILHLGEVKGYRWPSRELCNVDSISTLESCGRLRSTLEGFYTVHYVAELLDTAFAEEEPHPEFFGLSAGLLTLVEHAGLDRDLALRVLELRLLEELGYGLSFGKCVSCHQTEAAVAGFEPEEGGFVCESCLRRLPEALRVSPELREVLQRLLGTPLAGLSETELPRSLRRPLRQLCHRMLLYRLERPLRSARYLEEMDES